MASTGHLSTIEHGAYLLLIIHYFHTQTPLPNDDKRLANITKMSLKGWRQLKLTLSQKFIVNDRFWVHRRIENDLTKFREESSKRAAAVGVRWENERQKNDKNSDTSVLQMNIQNAYCQKSEVTSQNLKKKKTGKKESAASASPSLVGQQAAQPSEAVIQKNAELKKQAIEVLNFLNKKTGREYRPADVTLKLIIARLKSGASVQNCKSVIARKEKDWGRNEKMAYCLRPKTLFNETNFEQYLAEILDPEEDYNE